MTDWPLFLMFIFVSVGGYIIGFRHGMSYQRDVIDEKFK